MFDLGSCGGGEEGKSHGHLWKDLQFRETFPCRGCPVSVLPWFASWHTQLCLHLFLVWSQSLGFLCETIWKYLGFVLLWAL